MSCKHENYKYIHEESVCPQDFDPPSPDRDLYMKKCVICGSIIYISRIEYEVKHHEAHAMWSKAVRERKSQFEKRQENRKWWENKKKELALTREK